MSALAISQKKNKNMLCKLCHKEKKLLKKSHIIPNFMYRDLFDEKHRLYEAKFKSDNTIESKLRQSGGYEKNILCDDCDNKVLGSLESYSKSVLFGGISLKIRNEKNENGVICTFVEGLDYPKFKLFLLSLVWRASISTLSIFKNVSLGKHQDSIGNMIFHNKPGKYLDYPCAIFTYLNSTSYPHQLISEPGYINKKNKKLFFFLIGGALYIFFIEFVNLPPWVETCAINEKGDIRIRHMSDQVASQTLNKFIGMNFF